MSKPEISRGSLASNLLATWDETSDSEEEFDYFKAATNQELLHKMFADKRAAKQAKDDDFEQEMQNVNIDQLYKVRFLLYVLDEALNHQRITSW